MLQLVLLVGGVPIICSCSGGLVSKGCLLQLPE